jgi:hypothetical protein
MVGDATTRKPHQRVISTNIYSKDLKPKHLFDLIQHMLRHATIANNKMHKYDLTWSNGLKLGTLQNKMSKAKDEIEKGWNHMLLTIVFIYSKRLMVINIEPPFWCNVQD